MVVVYFLCNAQNELVQTENEHQVIIYIAYSSFRSTIWQYVLNNNCTILIFEFTLGFFFLIIYVSNTKQYI